MADEPDKHCPACGADNHCAIAAGTSPRQCWCHGVVVSEAAIEALPAPARGRRCLCPKCARVTKEE